MTKGNFARTAGLVVSTSIATAAIASNSWADELKFCVICITILVGAGLAAFAAELDRE
jgi:hypothetical protein